MKTLSKEECASWFHQGWPPSAVAALQKCAAHTTTLRTALQQARESLEAYEDQEVCQDRAIGIINTALGDNDD